MNDTRHPEVRRGPVWIDGALRAPQDAAISPWDHGLTVGDGVFETMKVVNGRPFALTRHLRRLRRSAAGLGMDLAVSDDELRAAVAATITANEVDRGRVRVTVTGGASPLGSQRGEAPATVLIAVAEARTWEPTATVVTVPWRRNEHSAVAGLKTTSYAENVVALHAAHEQGADEAILANTAGNLCEGTGSNIFVGIGGRLVTPPLSSGCLAGITRELVVELLGDLGAVDEVDLPIERLADCDEAFLTSSTRDVQPIAAIDGRTLSPCPGPLTTAAIDAFRELEARTIDP